MYVKLERSLINLLFRGQLIALNATQECKEKLEEFSKEKTNMQNKSEPGFKLRLKSES